MTATTVYRPGDTIVAQDSEGDQYTFVLADTYWLNQFHGALIERVTTSYEPGHGTEFTVKLRDDSVAQFRQGGGFDDLLDDLLGHDNTLSTIDPSQIGDN